MLLLNLKELMTNFKENLKKRLNSSSILKLRLKDLKTGLIKIGLLVSSIIFIKNIIRFDVLELEHFEGALFIFVRCLFDVDVFYLSTAELIFLRSQIVEQMSCSLNSSDICETQS